jgi:hypothetical protein
LKITGQQINILSGGARMGCFFSEKEPLNSVAYRFICGVESGIIVMIFFSTFRHPLRFHGF